VNDPEALYRGRQEELTARIRELESLGRALTLRRSVTFVAAFACWVGADFVSQGGLLRGVAGLILLAFIAMVRQHRRARRELRAARAALRWAETGLARLGRSWDLLPAPASPAPPDHPWANDLDLFGYASVASLLGPVHTPQGKASLASWLLEPSGPKATADRQAAVRELSARPELLEAVGVESELAWEKRAPEKNPDFQPFLEWCRTPAPVPPLIGAAGWVLPLLLLAFAAGHLAGVLPPRWWVLTLLVQAAIALRWGSRQHEAFAAVSDGVRGLSAVPPLLEIWEGQEVAAPRLVHERDRLHGQSEPASRAIRRLRRLVHLGDMRLSSLYPVFSIGLLWDVHLAAALERWRERHGIRVAGWFEALGVLEALSSLAVLGHDNPDWCWPEISVAGPAVPRVEAEGLGHPLLPPGSCVRNDVELGPPGSVLLVTGSNMSGKSTLLRSIGLGVVLGEAGAPVCARRFHAPAVRLRTSMRIQDSIESGVSFFMAELLRLKGILDAAATPGRPVLYLVDEILQGTNSEERQAASRHFIRHLLRASAIGAVTTHDLELHHHPEVEAAACMVHFREVVAEDGAALSFDYLLRPGLATTRNALLLAERVGITDPGEPTPPE
jgi:hypothetical protein